MFNGVFRGVEGPGINIRYDLAPNRYPFWLYKDGAEPVMVKNEDEEKTARADGYDTVTAGITANRYLVNWFWDLEDMSAKQLHIFAKEEYGVDLPIEAGQERLFRAVCELTLHAPQNQNRLILMAHTIKMNYDETIEEIKRMMVHPSQGMASETISLEFEA
jgi:hypothetical protein